MKIITNLDVEPYLALPSGVTINKGDSMPVLNEALLESPEIKQLLSEQPPRIRISVQPDGKS